MDDKWKAYTDKIGNFVGTLCRISYIPPIVMLNILQLMQQPAGRASYWGLFTERRFARIVQLAHCRVRKTIRRFCERYEFCCVI